MYTSSSSERTIVVLVRRVYADGRVRKRVRPYTDNPDYGVYLELGRARPEWGEPSIGVMATGHTYAEAMALLGDGITAAKTALRLQGPCSK